MHFLSCMLDGVGIAGLQDYLFRDAHTSFTLQLFSQRRYAVKNWIQASGKLDKPPTRNYQLYLRI